VIEVKNMAFWNFFRIKLWRERKREREARILIYL